MSTELVSYSGPGTMLWTHRSSMTYVMAETGVRVDESQD